MRAVRAVFAVGKSAGHRQNALGQLRRGEPLGCLGHGQCRRSLRLHVLRDRAIPRFLRGREGDQQRRDNGKDARQPRDRPPGRRRFLPRIRRGERQGLFPKVHAGERPRPRNEGHVGLPHAQRRKRPPPFLGDRRPSLPPGHAERRRDRVRRACDQECGRARRQQRRLYGQVHDEPGQHRHFRRQRDGADACLLRNRMDCEARVHGRPSGRRQRSNVRHGNGQQRTAQNRGRRGLRAGRVVRRQLQGRGLAGLGPSPELPRPGIEVHDRLRTRDRLLKGRLLRVDPSGERKAAPESAQAGLLWKPPGAQRQRHLPNGRGELFDEQPRQPRRHGSSSLRHDLRRRLGGNAQHDVDSRLEPEGRLRHVEDGRRRVQKAARQVFFPGDGTVERTVGMVRLRGQGRADEGRPLPQRRADLARGQGTQDGRAHLLQLHHGQPRGRLSGPQRQRANRRHALPELGQFRRHQRLLDVGDQGGQGVEGRGLPRRAVRRPRRARQVRAV